MTEPSVADVLEWEALPDETRERYYAIIREELYEEIHREVKAELDGDADDLRSAIEAALDILNSA